MNVITRDLLPYAIGRNTPECVTAIVVIPFPLDDGSFTFYKAEIRVMARVVPLTQNEINRLAERGITIQNGVSVSMVREFGKVPDSIIREDGTYMKVVKFTNREGALVMVCDVPALDFDGPSYGSGYP